jgi:PAS domain S-box-containing protein
MRALAVRFRGAAKRCRLTRAGIERELGPEAGQDVIGRLTAFDLPGRLQRRAPKAVVQVATGAILAGVAFALRAAIELVAPGVVPFALLFPAILVATGLGGWEAGLVALATGAGFSWRFLDVSLAIQPTMRIALVNLALFLCSGGLVIAAAAAYRATALALRDSQERLDLATSAAAVGVWEWRCDSEEVFYSPEARRICGFALDGPVTRLMTKMVTHPDDMALTQAQFERALDPDVREETVYEYRIVRPTGEVRWVHASGRVVFERRGDGVLAPVRYVGTLQDVTARKADEERLRLLAREVDHRANNLLAVVQGTVALSEAKDSKALKSVITGRVNALARAHQLLARARWEGADLRRLVEEELLAFSLGDEQRVAISGPAVTLSPAAAQSVAMALHELATNAAKYGSLSTAHGRVEVSWTRGDDGELHIAWRERGGPRVSAPTRKGLGTTLLGRALTGPIGGETRLE